MFRRSVVGLLMLVLFGGVVLADTFTGKLDKLDTGKGTGIVRDSDDKPHPFKVTADTKVVDADGKDIKDGIKGVKTGSEVKVTTDGKGKKMVTKEVKVTKEP